jgi:hypothetical protein
MGGNAGGNAGAMRGGGDTLQPLAGVPLEALALEQRRAVLPEMAEL